MSLNFLGSLESQGVDRAASSEFYLWTRYPLLATPKPHEIPKSHFLIANREEAHFNVLLAESSFVDFRILRTNREQGRQFLRPSRDNGALKRPYLQHPRQQTIQFRQT